VIREVRGTQRKTMKRERREKEERMSFETHRPVQVFSEYLWSLRVL
jgi:hypothetical protein